MPRGTWLASVRFQGVEHVHLTRVRLAPGGTWRDPGSYLVAQPDTFFAYTDTEPPRFEGAVHYLDDASGASYARDAAGARPVISGDVDVVVGLRDVGEYARQGTSAIADRLAVSRLAYEIAPVAGGDTLRQLSLDFRTAEIPRLGAGGEARIAQTVFAFYERFHPGGTPAWRQSRVSYYVVTNTPPGGRTGVLSPADRDHAWRTADRRPDGTPRFPNGDYVVTVRAWDFKGNAAVRRDTVRVRN